jgi:hypothetical protein
LDPTKVLLFAQIVVQIILLGLVVFFIVLEKKRKPPTNVLDELKSVVQDTQNLTNSFHEQVNKKIEIVTKVMNELDAKTREAETIIKGLEKTALNAKQVRQYSSEDVLRLHNGGFALVDISQITGIPVGEVQLMIKVKDQNNT